MQNMEKINANLIELHVGRFESPEDKKTFDEFCKKLYSMNQGIVITPILSDNGELMSFIVDSKKASEILEDTKDD